MSIPRKRFGQNFLTDPGIIDRIHRGMGIKAEDHVIEIGPGRGALTSGLAASDCHLTLIEVDRDLAGQLTLDYPGTELINQDVLKVEFQDLGPGPVRVVGNLPYNISTPLLFKLLEYDGLFQDMHFMLQLEVVDRMIAVPSTKAYGRLSVMTQLYCHAEKLFEVPAEAFSPRPKVRSAIVRLTPRPGTHLPDPLESVLIQAFSARRKTVRNALKGLLTEADLESLDIDPTLRPENLSPEEFMSCADLLGSRQT